MLKYEMNYKQNGYVVVGCSGIMTGDLEIPLVYNGKPVTSIDNYAFEGYTGLTSVTIPNGVTSIGDSAFGNCIGLTSVTIPDSVTYIGGNAFYGCENLVSITIPDSVTSIGERVFAKCSNLEQVTIRKSDGTEDVYTVSDEEFVHTLLNSLVYCEHY